MKLSRLLVVGLALVVLCATAGFAAGSQELASRAVVKPAGQLGKYDPPITISTVFATQPYHEFNEGDSYEDNPWIRAYRDMFGIEIEYAWIVPADQEAQKINLMIASGDLPDFFMAKADQYKQLIDVGLIQDMTDIFDEYATPQVRATILEGGESGLQSSYINGKMWGVPWTLNQVEQGHVTWSRQDWLDNLGLERPTTMQEFLAIAKAFGERDPDQNGKDDTYGIALDKELGNAVGFMAGYHAYQNIWVEQADGALGWGGVQPEMKDALSALAALYADGLIDPEFPVKDLGKVGEDFAQNRLGLMTGYYGSMGYPLNSTIQNNPEAEFVSEPLLSIDSDPAKHPLPFAVNGYWVAREGWDYPEAILKMMHFWVETFYYPANDDIQHTYNDRPNWYYSLVKTYRATRNIEWMESLIPKVTTGTFNLDGLTTAVSKMVMGQIIDWDKDGRPRTTTSPFAWYNGLNGGSYSILAGYYRNNLYQFDAYFGPPTEGMSKWWGPLTDLQTETFVKIITNQLPIGAFDDFVKQWNSLGGSEVTAEVNQWYNSR